jgi:hypothetical protein
MSYFYKRLCIFFLVVQAPTVICRGQDLNENQADAEEMRSRIEVIVRKAALPLQLSDPSSPIRVTSSQTIFSLEDVKEVQKYGGKSGSNVVVLSSWQRSQERTRSNTTSGSYWGGFDC